MILYNATIIISKSIRVLVLSTVVINELWSINDLYYNVV